MTDAITGSFPCKVANSPGFLESSAPSVDLFATALIVLTNRTPPKMKVIDASLSGGLSTIPCEQHAMPTIEAGKDGIFERVK